MVKDLKYIIKKIIIGTGIALAIMTIKGNFMLQAHALEVYSYYAGGDIDVINNTQWETFYNLDNHWASWGTGYIRFNFTVQKVAESTPSNTTPLITPRAVYISTGNADFICDIGSVNTQNATYNAQIYSAMCPVSFYDGGGLKKIHIYFQDQQYNAQGQAKVSFDGHITFEKPSDSFDISGIVNGSNQNTQSIINNQNQNTQSIVDSQNNINNSINDSTTDNPNNDVNSMNSKVASNNSITQLLTLPITLFQNILNNINGSCSSYNLGSLYGHNLTLPCINLASILGSTLWGVIDVLISGLFILSFRKKMVDIFNHMSSLNDRGNELE